MAENADKGGKMGNIMFIMERPEGTEYTPDCHM
jgi:hypothetical protein